MQNVFKTIRLSLLALSFIGAQAHAERYRGVMAPTDVSSSYPTKVQSKLRISSPKTVSNLFGGIELRPGVETTEGAVSSENSAWLGVDFKSWSLSYNQDLETGASNTEGAWNPVISDGHVKAKLDNLWTDGKTGFHDEVRVYAPTNASKRDKGMVTVIRNYFKLSHKLSPVVSLGIQEVPILHLYSDAGSVTDTGPAANPSFENRLIFNMDFAITENITFSIPLHLYSTKYRNYAEGAKLNDEWDPNLFIWPEFNFRFTGSPIYLGVAYRTNNLMSVTEEGTTSDFNGTFQGVFGVTF